MIVSIGPATCADAAGVAPVFRQYLKFYRRDVDEAAITQFLRDRLANDECAVFMATVGAIDPRPVGFTLLYPTFSSLGLRPTWILNDLFVVAAHRRTGIARRLLRAAQRHAILTGATAISLESATSNRIARDLYESEGYRRDSVFVGYSLTLPEG